MRLFRRCCAAAVLLASLWLAHEARADGDPVSAFRDFGLLGGVWSPNCAEPPSRDNPRVTWFVSGGVVGHWVSFDGRRPVIVDTVVSADILDEGHIRVVIARGGWPMFTSTWEMVGDKLHTVRSESLKSFGSRVFYEGGVEVATGKPAVLDERCGTPTS